MKPRSVLVSASEFAGFGNAYLTNMQLNALSGGMYNPGQSNPGCLFFCQ
jgi:hypothetical protein